MRALRDQVHPTRFRDLAVTVDFHCNSACTFCIVQEGMNDYRGVPFERFAAICEENLRSRKYDRVIFTGGEVTLERSLFRFVERARQGGAFQHVRVQTNGRKLADPAYARALIEAGVDELFVSLHGDRAALHDAITRRAGSFDELVRGLENIRALPVRVITNSVIHQANAGALAGIVEVAHLHGVREMELWSYLPMEDHADERGLIAPLSVVMPSLRRALDRCASLGIRAITKYVPRCLLGEHGETLDNSQPDTIIVESFWDEFPRFACLYEGVCEHSDECLGLAHDYIRKHGWEESTLVPVGPSAGSALAPSAGSALAPSAGSSPGPSAGSAPGSRKREWRPRTRPEEGRPDGTEPVSSHPAWEALLSGLPPSAGRLVRVQLNRTQARFTLATPRGVTVELVLAARDERNKALARTASFNVFYSGVDGASGDEERQELQRLLRAACERVSAHDDGSLSLDARKGLIQLSRKAKERPQVL